MTFSSDFSELLSAFNEAGVRYLIVGALAVSYHGQPRASMDFDVWVEPSLENAAKVRRALASFGAPAELLPTIEELGSDDLIYQIGVVPLRIDVITGISGVAFHEAWEKRVTDTLAGVRVSIIGFDDLVTNKLASGRDKDLLDVRRLRRAARDGDA